MYKDINVIELDKMIQLEEKFALIDVRTNIEYDKNPIPGSLNIPLHDIIHRYAEINHFETVVVYCQKGIRSIYACNLLCTQGIKNVYNLRGGVSSWLRAEL